jgi:DNA-binding MarR family transcriptional regulator
VSTKSLQHRFLQAETVLAVERITRSVNRRMEHHFAEAGLKDITPQQAKVLMVLFQAKGSMNAKKLAEELGISQVTVGRFIKALKENGWVKWDRDPEDARAILLGLSPKAYEAFPRFVGISNALMDEVFGAFEGPVFEQFAANVARVHQTLSGLDKAV